MALWEEPKLKKWWSFFCGDLHLGTLQECAEVDRERLRLRGLIGVSVVPASPECLIVVGAKTVLSKRIVGKMQDAYKEKLATASSVTGAR